VGKYDHVLDKLPKLLGEEPDYQARIDAVKREILTKEKRYAATFAAEYAKVRREKAIVKKILSEIDLRLTAYEQLVVDQFEVEATKSLTLEGGDIVRIQPEPYLVVEDKEKFRQWCIANGMERELHLLWQTANSLCKERLIIGEPEPEGTRVFNRVKIVFTAGE
jgi:hypothetical protein